MIRVHDGNPRGAARAWWARRARLTAFVMLTTWAIAARQARGLDPVAASPAAAVAEALADRGLACTAGDVTWIDGPGGIPGAIAGRSRALVRASAGEDPSDLYLVNARLSPEGEVLAVDDAWDLTNTSGVDESRPILRSTWAAYTTSADGLVTGVHVLDLAGAAPDSYAAFTLVQRVQAAVTNWQQTGQAAGVAHTAFALDPVAGGPALGGSAVAAGRLAWRDDGTLEARGSDRLVVIDPKDSRVLEGAELVRVVRDERARPGNLITWAVDRVRSSPWFGDDKMQWVKAVAFTILDKARATFSRGTTAEDVRDELGLDSNVEIDAPAGASFADPEVGWPPRPIAPVLARALPGEGKWIALDKDPFITPTASGSPPPFVTSFVRPDALRPDVRVYVTLWDPRQIALHMEAGTVEPISATGEHGTGLIPRAPEVIRHLVAAFNGGFQAQHGEYGMRADGIEYLPPKPYAATVVELKDGSNGFGAWPGSAPVPDDVLALRQNLTALVQNGKFNPWGRNWWGGAPPGWPDQIHTARSALCLTKEGFAGYFYSTSISAEDLAQGMLAARCAFGIHLDMNPGHAGFEFYDVAAEDDEHAMPLGRPLQGDWEAQGKVPGMPGFVFRSRRMIRGMGHMLFPRYIQREARDFFYLTSRAILPGAAVTRPAGAPPGDPDEGVWQTKALPQHGFPYALATTWVRADRRPDLKLRVVRADPRTMKPGEPGEGAGADEATVLSLVSLSLVAPHGAAPALRLWSSGGMFSVATTPPGKGAVALAEGYGFDDPLGATARAGVGVEDEDGMLVWVELPRGARADPSASAAIDGVLSRLGCSTRMLLAGEARALLGGALDAAGDPLPPFALRSPPGTFRTARLVRAAAPDAHPVFVDTPIVPIAIWQPLQAKRVRYFYEPPPSAPSASVASVASPAPAASRHPAGDSMTQGGRAAPVTP